MVGKRGCPVLRFGVAWALSSVQSSVISTVCQHSVNRGAFRSAIAGWAQTVVQELLWSVQCFIKANVKGGAAQLLLI